MRRVSNEALAARAFDITLGDSSGARVVHLSAAEPGPLLVGTSVICHVRLHDRSVSRRHAALELTEAGLRFTDLGSTNGSFLGPTRVVEVLLTGGETLRLGNVLVQIGAASEDPGVVLSPRTSFGSVRGGSLAMRRLYPVLERLAASKVPVVLEGEAGTGKEALAEALHEEGPLRDGPFVVVDVAHTPPAQLAVELQGQERGAPGAARRRGAFELAHGGTLFVDEIADLDLELQAVLVKVLERREIRRVGGEHTIPIDVRVLAGTRRDLDREVQAGRFRDDLYHHLAVARVEVPPLRARRDDVPALAQLFWERAGGAAADFPIADLARWKDLPWPGNVRELERAVSRRFALGASAPEPSGADAEPVGSLDAVLAMDLPLPEARRIVAERLEQAYVERMLERHGGVVRRAAEASGIALRHFQRIKAKGGHRP